MNDQPQAQEKSRPSRNTLLFAAIVVVVLVVVIMIALSKQQDMVTESVEAPQTVVIIEPEEPATQPDEPISEPETMPQALPQSEREQPTEQVEQEPALPSLDESDDVVSERVSQSLSQASADLLVNDDLIRRAVVFVNNLADGQVAANHSPVTKLQEPFSVEQGEVLTMDPQSFSRYDPYVAILTSLQTEQLVALYQRYEPLIEQAYAEVGRPDTHFNERLTKAIDLLLATPEMTTQVPLLKDSVTYKYAFSEWENLPPAQKQLLRMGPENVAKIKAVLTELRSELQ
ncbi:DUF3014 domain-containing protein [Pseudoalteromonas sp. SSDWG2]|uniref:DUF3014 domain-containing protein n=1 Tax=Pseudoalteromonas sp. SSDWG2 TaxID=3139391 RepID=UPI003BAD5B01